MRAYIFLLTYYLFFLHNPKYFSSQLLVHTFKSIFELYYICPTIKKIEALTRVFFFIIFTETYIYSHILIHVFFLKIFSRNTYFYSYKYKCIFFIIFTGTKSSGVIYFGRQNLLEIFGLKQKFEIFVEIKNLFNPHTNITTNLFKSIFYFKKIV
jgi:hypothetical protein